jgi:cobaltochelatase CobS
LTVAKPSCRSRFAAGELPDRTDERNDEMTPNTTAANLAHENTDAWPQEAWAIAASICQATGVTLGHRLAGSIATPVGDTDLKTQLRRLYAALGGKRTGTPSYDPSADELRGLYAGVETAAGLMAKSAAGTATVEPKAAEKVQAAEQHFGPAVGAAMAEALEAETAAKPAPAPLVQQAKGTPANAADALTAAIAAIANANAPQIDEQAVRSIVASETDAKLADVAQRVDLALASVEPRLQAMIDAASRKLEITVGDAPAVKIDKAHAMLEPLLKAVVAGVSPFVVGPAGSGKTTLAKQIADALGRPFYMSARVTSEYKLLGFVDATGKAVRTDFRNAYENGGGFLFDEADASDADAFVALNAALANGFCDFPDGQVQQHPEFFCIAAGNTYGRGANRQYVGRQQLDAATLDRFVIFDVDYDEALELAIAGNDDWTRHVQKVRRAVERENVRHIVSPRASIFGAKMLAAGLDRKQVEEACIWKGMAETERNRVTAAIR